MELERFVCDRVTPTIIEKLQSKGIAMRAYGISVYYAYTGSQMDLGGAVQNGQKDRARFELQSSSLMNLAVPDSPCVGIIIITLSNKLCVQQLCR